MRGIGGELGRLGTIASKYCLNSGAVAFFSIASKNCGNGLCAIDFISGDAGGSAGFGPPFALDSIASKTKRRKTISCCYTFNFILQKKFFFSC